MKTWFNRLRKGPNFSWNAFLVLLLVMEFVIFGSANQKFLRPALLHPVRVQEHRGLDY